MYRIRGFILLIALFAAMPVSAQTIPFGNGDMASEAPVEIAANLMQVNQDTGRAEFSGDVLIGQGEMKLSADRVLVQYKQGDQSKISSFDAIGKVTLVQGQDAAEAQRAIYDVDAGTVTLTGDVLLAQGRNVMSGERIVVNLSDGTAQASGRVRTVLQPDSAQ